MMTLEVSWLRLGALAGAVALLPSCGGDEDGVADGGVACQGAKCDDPDPEDFACKAVTDASGREANAAFLEGLGDPVASIILKRPGACPNNFEEIMDKFRLEDKTNCEGGERSGIATRVISERAQLLGTPAPMRTVISRQCEDRPAFGVLFSLFGIQPGGSSLPQNNTELISFDQNAGVFNYYTLRREGSSNKWTFHGSSMDFVDANHSGQGRECARCHTDGGLIMKELKAPWVHWEGDTVTPGAIELVDRHEDLGSRGNGIDLENLVRAGNTQWNSTRLKSMADEARDDLHNGTLKEALRPVFCPTSFNLASGGGPKFGGGFPPILPFPGGPGGPGPAPEPAPEADDAPGGADLVQFPANFFVNSDRWIAFSGVGIDTATYNEQLAAVGSRVGNIPGARDTFFRFTFPERAGADRDYVDQLIASGIVDEEFVKDVAVIDFTNPLFSEDRCGLLEFVPTFADLDAFVDGGTDSDSDSDSDTDSDSDSGGGGLPDGGSCCAVQPLPSCDVMEVQECVCDKDRFCCESSWDNVCVGEVVSLGCGSCGGGEPPPMKGECCSVHNTPGCSDAAIEQCVCDKDAFCCNNEWDQVCVNQVTSENCGPCGQGIDGADEQRISSGSGVSQAAPTSELIRKAMIAALEKQDFAKGTPGNELLVNLGATEQKEGHRQFVQDFLAACQDRSQNRDQAQLIRDVLEVAALLREEAEGFSGMLEFPETMVTDDLNPPGGLHFDRATCELTTE